MDLQVTCPICLNILYRPVILPCKHEFCNDCIRNALDQTAYCCPLCRYRLSNWLRRVKDIEVLIDKDRENVLRRQFPAYFRGKDLGMSPQLSTDEEQALRIMTNDTVKPISKSGDIYADYLKEAERLTHLRTIENNKNEEASLALSRQMLVEDALGMFDGDLSSSIVVESSDDNVPHEGKERTAKEYQKFKQVDKTLVENNQLSLLKYVTKGPARKPIQYQSSQCQSSIPEADLANAALPKTNSNPAQPGTSDAKHNMMSNGVEPHRYFIRGKKCESLQNDPGHAHLMELPGKMPPKRAKVTSLKATHKNIRSKAGNLPKRKSLLEYAVDKRSLVGDSDNSSKKSDSVANDEEFARELQKMYLKLPYPNSPIIAKIRPRSKASLMHW